MDQNSSKDSGFYVCLLVQRRKSLWGCEEKTGHRYYTVKSMRGPRRKRNIVQKYSKASNR